MLVEQAPERSAISVRAQKSHESTALGWATKVAKPGSAMHWE